MLEQFYTLPAVLRRHRARLLGPHLDTFVAGSSDLGYVRETVRHQCDIVGCFSDWLERRGLEVADIDRSVIDRHVCWRGRTGRAAERVTLLRFFEHMQTRGVIQRPSPGPRPSRVEALIARFEKHLTLQRRVLPTTAAGYAAFAQEFLSASHQDGGPRLRNLRASDVSKFVVTWTRTRPRGRARLLVTALRSFCRFLLQNGEIDADLAAAVPSVAGWRLAGLPRHLPPEQVERILECCDRNTTKGRRDYAVIMLLARLGVRACEVVRLELDDVDGHAGELIVRGKGHREDRLPLVPEVGQALADYLRNGRPVCATRRVFVRTRAPIRGIGVQGVETIVCRAMERASLDPPSKGAHTLRHSLATRMLAGGASMSEIAEVLRHRRPQTTEIYAKVDFGALRCLALPWPTKEDGR